jgi:hypothetical protein
MLVDMKRESHFSSSGEEIVIVGSGAVGLILAIDLARSGCAVCVLEAGPLKVSDESQEHFRKAKSVGRKLDGLHLGRFRALGGTTNFWGGQLVKFDPIVFGSREWVSPFAKWPITIEDLDVHYDRVFSLVGMHRVIKSDVDVEAKLKLSLPRPDTNLDFFFTRWAPEPNWSTLFKKEIETLPNLRVVLNAPVVGLDISDCGSVIKGLIVKGPSERSVSVTGRAYVLAHGTVEIARLLMASKGNSTPAGWENNTWLGKGFMDHVDCVAGTVKPKDPKRFNNIFENAIVDGIKYQPKLKLSESAQRDNQLLGSSCHFIFKSSLSENIGNAKVFFKALLRGRLSGGPVNLIRQVSTLITVGTPMVFRYLRYRRVYSPSDGGIDLRLTSEQSMVLQSGLSLDREKDSLGLPLVNLNWEINENQIKTISSFAIMVKKYLESNGLATVKLSQALTDDGISFLRQIDDANHQMGMVRMGASSSEGVVDKNLRVHGVSNLFVAGASVFPSTGFANPTLTAMALALRLAEHLKGGEIHDR